MELRKNFPIQAERLKTLRESQKLTQQQLCKILDHDLKTYRSWEKGESRPNGYDLVRLASLYGVSCDYILGLINEKNHDLQFIHDFLGLSEKAIRKIKRNDVDTVGTVNLVLETEIFYEAVRNLFLSAYYAPLEESDVDADDANTILLYQLAKIQYNEAMIKLYAELCPEKYKAKDIRKNLLSTRFLPLDLDND